jgi:hypothetical protein
MAVTAPRSTNEQHVAAGRDRLETRRWWLALTAPIVVVGMATAAIGLLAADGSYGAMAGDWADQTRAQDIVDLVVVFPVLGVLGAVAWRRGSTAALLAWLGVLASLAYTYVIYAFDVPFGPLFPTSVALLGLTAWSVVGAARALDRDDAGRRVGPRAPLRTAGWTLVVAGTLFYVVWLGGDLPALASGTLPEDLRSVRLPTNPVHVLDMAFVLPACILAGAGLLRGRIGARWAAPVLLAMLASISVSIVAIMAVAAAGGEHGVLPVGIGIGVIGLGIAALLVRYLREVGRADA